MEIQIVLTGGTIGSEYGLDDVIALTNINLHDENVGCGAAYIGRIPKHSGAFSSPIFCDAPAAFARADWHTHISSPFQIHSENLTPAHWRRLAVQLRALPLADSDALIITHGTDTLAYTANFLALLLHGLEIPVFLLSSDRPLADADANGHANIRRTEQLIAAGVEPGVYVPYRNRDGRTIVHKAERLLQAGDFSDDFQSVTNPNVNDLNRLTAEIRETARGNRPFAPAECGDNVSVGHSDTASAQNGGGKSLLYATPFDDSARTPSILALRPFPGLDLSYYNFEALDAILMGTYHSGTIPGGEISVTIGDSDAIPAALGDSDGAANPHISLSAPDIGVASRFAEKAARAGIPVYAAPLYAHAVTANADACVTNGLATPAAPLYVHASSADQNTDVPRGRKPYAGTHAQIKSGLVRPLYDMSFEMAFAYLNFLHFCKL